MLHNIMKKLLLKKLLFGIILIFASCQMNKDGFEISANLKGFAENSKVIVTNASNSKIIDSTFIVNDKFRMNGFLNNSPSNISIAIISPDGKNKNYTSIFMGNENVSINGTQLNFSTGLIVKGSKHHEFKIKLDNEINSLNDQRRQKLSQMFSLRNEGKWNDSLQNAYWAEGGIINEIDHKIRKKTKKFISENINSHFALSHLILIKNEYSMDFIKEQINSLDSEFSKTEYAQVLKTYVANMPLKKDEIYYDFNAENQKGQSVAFNSFFNDKEFVLLEFSSAYCGWCKKALPDIKKLKNSNNNNLEVITYNVDKHKQDWLKATKSDEINWTSLWNESGRYSDAYTKYRVSGTPTYYLFDKQGKVINAWNGYDENLVTSIQQLIK